MSDWIEIRASLASVPEDWSPFVSSCEEHGCPSSLQSDSPPELLAYLEETPASMPIAESLRSELLDLGAEAVTITVTPEQDWTELWRHHFKPIRVGKHLVVCPTWETFDCKADDILILIDPGQAFGTGDHSTTKLCLTFLEKYAGVNTTSLLDLGTGSGILSIAAKKLGVKSVLGTDIDPIAIEVAKENASRNGVDCSLICAPGLDGSELDRQWPVVISNIISATLIRLAPQVALRVQEGGLWIVSGIIESNWADVLAAAETSGFSLVEMALDGDWVAAVLKKLPT